MDHLRTNKRRCCFLR